MIHYGETQGGGDVVGVLATDPDGQAAPQVCQDALHALVDAALLLVGGLLFLVDAALLLNERVDAFIELLLIGDEVVDPPGEGGKAFRQVDQLVGEYQPAGLLVEVRRLLCSRRSRSSEVLMVVMMGLVCLILLSGCWTWELSVAVVCPTPPAVSPAERAAVHDDLRRVAVVRCRVADHADPDHVVLIAGAGGPVFPTFVGLVGGGARVDHEGALRRTERAAHLAVALGVVLLVEQGAASFWRSREPCLSSAGAGEMICVLLIRPVPHPGNDSSFAIQD